LYSKQWECGSTWIDDSGLKWAQSWNQIQMLKECPYCHIYCAYRCTPLYRTVTASCAVSNRESLYPPARSLEDETLNARQNAIRNPEWWGNVSQLQFQIKPKSRFEFVPRDTEEFKFNQNLNSNLYREIPRNLIFSILTS